MNQLGDKSWSTGSGLTMSLREISSKVSEHIQNNNKIFIGSDSFLSSKKVCFVTTVCILSERKGGKYFFYKEKAPSNVFSVLSTRMTEETRRSVELAEYFMNNYNVCPSMIELHLDISPAAAMNKTSKFSEMLKGYVQGYGLSCKLKPNAWASQTVADRHSK